MNKIFTGIFTRVGRKDLVAEHAAAFVELLLVDLAACIPLLENIERSASQLHMVGRLRPVPRPAEPAHKKNGDRNHHA